MIDGTPQVSPRPRDANPRADDEPRDAAGDAPAGGRTASVALVVSEAEQRFVSEPFFASLVRTLSAELAGAGMHLMVAIAQSPQDRRRLDEHLTPDNVDGVLMVSLHGGDPLPERLEQRGTPTVLGGRPIDLDPVSYVDVDNSGGARQAVDHLISRGRRRIAAITGPQDMTVGVDRLEGYWAALQAARIGRDRHLIAAGNFSEDSGRAAMYALLEQRPDLDAVFAASDPMAIGALHALRSSGLRVPDDVAVVGFEDSPLARHTVPPLTTIRQPVDQMARQMVRLLLARIHGRDTSRSVILQTELVVRDST